MEIIKKKYSDIVLQKWSKYGIRERILLSICFVILLIFFVYQLYNFIFFFNIKSKESELKNKQYVLANIIPAVKKIEKIKSGQVEYKKIPNTHFIDFIKNDINSLNTQKLNNDVYMIHGGVVRVDIKEINFDIIISWLQNISQTYGVRVKRALIERIDKKVGDVRFVVELER